MADRSFSYNLSLEDRLEQLVNNEFHADVFFRLGDEGKLMFGHKNILSLASEVFYAQLNGGFSEAKENTRDNPIVVTDIDPVAFEKVLRFMYCGKVALCEDSIAGIYYTAQKYILEPLLDMCKKFIHETVNEMNVLKVLDGNQQYKITAIDEACLEIISDDPLKFFEHEDFLTLSFRSVESIARIMTINCERRQLVEAINSWSKVNELQCRDATNLAAQLDDSNVLTLRSQTLHSYSDFQYVINPSTTLELSVLKDIALYGLGVFVKTQVQYKGFAFINVKISITRPSERFSKRCVAAERKVCLTKKLSVELMMFKKILVEANSFLYIRCSMYTERKIPLFCQRLFKSIDLIRLCGLADLENMPTLERPYSYSDDDPLKRNIVHNDGNVISYIVYNIVEKSNENEKRSPWGNYELSYIF